MKRIKKNFITLFVLNSDIFDIESAEIDGMSYQRHWNTCMCLKISQACLYHIIVWRHEVYAFMLHEQQMRRAET